MILEASTPQTARQSGTHSVRVALIIPACNEEESITETLEGVAAATSEEAPQLGPLQVIVVDNGSTDRTAELAVAKGALVISEPRRGYGRACLAGLMALDAGVNVIAFMDADASDHPADLANLLAPIRNDEADFVMGSRVLGEREPGSLTPQQNLGNRLATWLLRILYGVAYTDLGPFRMIRRDALAGLQMQDTGYGWTVEMQIKAHRAGRRIREIPVRHRRRRAGKSKVSGSVRGTLLAGAKIIWTILRLRFSPPRPGATARNRLT